MTHGIQNNQNYQNNPMGNRKGKTHIALNQFSFLRDYRYLFNSGKNDTNKSMDDKSKQPESKTYNRTISKDCDRKEVIAGTNPDL